MDEYKCQRCGDDGPDLRTLHMSCMYQMTETGLPLKLVERPGQMPEYQLLVCKQCRGSWLESLKVWFNRT